MCSEFWQELYAYNFWANRRWRDGGATVEQDYLTYLHERAMAGKS